MLCNSQGDGGSHITVLTLAWAYVLAARWAEVLSGTMQYTDMKAPKAERHEQTNLTSCTVDIGTASHASVRWWAAVLANGQGWQASVLHCGQNLQSPWAIQLNCTKISISFVNSLPCQTAESLPPTSAAAASYILQYVSYHRLENESSAAFCAALLLPTANSARQSIFWPLPSPKSPPPLVTQDANSSPPWGRHTEQLDRLLTMGCHAQGMESLLRSNFIDTDIPCNISGAWLQGTFELLDSPLLADDSILVQVVMRRSPKINFLWLGAILVGLRRHILKLSRAVM